MYSSRQIKIIHVQLNTSTNKVFKTQAIFLLRSSCVSRHISSSFEPVVDKPLISNSSLSCPKVILSGLGEITFSLSIFWKKLNFKLTIFINRWKQWQLKLHFVQIMLSKIILQTVDKGIKTIYVALDNKTNVCVIYSMHLRCRHDWMIHLQNNLKWWPIPIYTNYVTLCPMQQKVSKFISKQHSCKSLICISWWCNSQLGH